MHRTVTELAARTVVTPEGLVERGVVVVEDDRIVEIRELPPAAAAPDRILVPGFVDLQVNGIDDVDVAGAASDADWERLDALLVAQGTTTWCPTLVTGPLDGYAEALHRIAAAAARNTGVPVPTIAGAHLEGPFIANPGAHRRRWMREPDLGWLAGLPDIVRVVTLAPELPGALEAVRLLAGRGVLVALGHSLASFEQAQAGADAGAHLVTHLFNAMGPLHHRDPGLVGAALADARLHPSLIADGVHVHPAVLGAAFAAAGGRAVLVTDASAWRAGRVGRVAIDLVDGAPRLPDGTLAGSALTMDAAVRRLVTECRVALADAVAAASTTPARLLGLDDRGALSPGRRADIVALSPGLEVEDVWIAGVPALASR